jgi:hypothetical protein
MWQWWTLIGFGNNFYWKFLGDIAFELQFQFVSNGTVPSMTCVMKAGGEIFWYFVLKGN